MKNKILEAAWLIIAILAIVAAIIETSQNGFRQSYRFYIFFLIAISVYFLRRNHRKNKSGQENQIPEK